MKKLTTVLLVAVSLGSAMTAWGGRTSYRPAEEISAEAESAFGELLDLWHEKRYDDLYDRTQQTGKLTRKAFAGRLAKARHHPACCWQKLQEVRVTVKNDDNVVIRAKIGLEGPGDTEYRPGTFKLRRVGGVWRASRSELLSLAGSGKKKRYTKKQ